MHQTVHLTLQSFAKVLTFKPKKTKNVVKTLKQTLLSAGITLIHAPVTPVGILEDIPGQMIARAATKQAVKDNLIIYFQP